MGRFTECTGRLHLGMGCYCRVRFFMASIFLGFTSPLFSQFASCDWWRVQFLLVAFSPCGPLLLGCLLASTSVLPPCFLFFSLSWMLSFYKVWRGFINNNYKSCTSISQHPMVMWSQGQTITNVACSITEQNP
jgi:hypothetical protein